MFLSEFVDVSLLFEGIVTSVIYRSLQQSVRRSGKTFKDLSILPYNKLSELKILRSIMYAKDFIVISTLCLVTIQIGFTYAKSVSTLEEPLKKDENKTSLPPPPPPSVAPTSLTTTPKGETTTSQKPETTSKPKTTPETTTTAKTETTTKSETTIKPETTTTKPIETTTIKTTSTSVPTTSPTTPSTPTNSTIPPTQMTTNSPNTTEEPSKDRRFDGPSFIGGIVLSVGIMAIAFVSWKFYKARSGRNYHTL